MDDEISEVSSELYSEFDYTTNIQPNSNSKNVVSKFPFKDIPISPKLDNDGDLIVTRKLKVDEYDKVIEIEHSKSTNLHLVGLQIWRGALLLADWLISNGKDLPEGYILELGSGVGLTSIIASMFKPVICTDINLGGLLELIQNNITRNKQICKFSVQVKELNFMEKFSDEIDNILPNVNIILAADVIYDNALTDAFITTVENILKKCPSGSIYVALEKRFVFILADCDTCAPCYEYFLERLDTLKGVTTEQVPIDFPQYFQYDRVKELVLWKISSSG